MEPLQVNPRVLQLKREATDPSMVLSAVVEAHNDNDDYVAFKVKTTAPRRYCVTPKFGVMKPFSSVLIKLMYRAEELGDSSDRFLILSMPLPKHVDIAAPEAIKDLWSSTIDKSIIRKVMFKAVPLGPSKRNPSLKMGEREAEEEAINSEDEHEVLEEGGGGMADFSSTLAHGAARDGDLVGGDNERVDGARAGNGTAGRESGDEREEAAGGSARPERRVSLTKEQLPSTSELVTPFRVYGDADDGLVQTSSDVPESGELWETHPLASEGLEWVEEHPTSPVPARPPLPTLMPEGEEFELTPSASLDASSRRSAPAGRSRPADPYTPSTLPSAQIMQIAELSRRCKSLEAERDDLQMKINAYKRTVASLAGANETIRARARKTEKQTLDAEEQLKATNDAMRAGPTWVLFSLTSLLCVWIGFLLRAFAW
eukprot:TRINITY_DN10296_c0_g1_i1.p1 TRINITY_DN10296_c0_g1~~TRINITY_DN10296_c0_g1_i1.p1  ORF type:complete len:429 (-),score=114.85 TRINITY_DN10296_c0_g1_i1:39-1325(-)